MPPPSSATASAATRRPSARRTWPPGCGRSAPPNGTLTSPLLVRSPDPSSVAPPAPVRYPGLECPPSTADVTVTLAPKPAVVPLPETNREVQEVRSPAPALAAEPNMGTTGKEDDRMLCDRKRWISCTSFPQPKRRPVQAIRKFPAGCGRERSISNGTSSSVKLRLPKEAVNQEGTQANGFESAMDNNGKKMALDDGTMVAQEAASCDENNEGNDELVKDRKNVLVANCKDLLSMEASISDPPSSAPSLVKEFPKEKKKVQSPPPTTAQEKASSREISVVKSIVGVRESSKSIYIASEDVPANEFLPVEALRKADPVEESPILRLEDGDAIIQPLNDKAKSVNVDKVQESPRAGPVKLQFKRGLAKKKISEVMGSHQMGAARNWSSPVAVEPAVMRDDTDKLMKCSSNNLAEPVDVDAKTFGNIDGENDEQLEGSSEQRIIQGTTWTQGKTYSGNISRSIEVRNIPKKVVKFAGRTSVPAKKSVPMVGSLRAGIKKVDKGKVLMPEGGKVLKGHETKQRYVISGILPPCVPQRHNSAERGDEHLDERSRVKKILKMFQVIFRKLLQSDESTSKHLGQEKPDKGRRTDLRAYHLIKNSELINKRKFIGSVPGVEVGDEFHYRIELSIVGLHGPFQGGIDTVEVEKGKRVAVSIVASGGYADVLENPNELIYTGSGGKAEGNKEAKDQQLKGPNLALKNCIEANSPVRVIHGFKVSCNGKMMSTFTYDGLYMVERCYKDLSPEQKIVYKYVLKRLPNQPELSLHAVKKREMGIRDGLRTEDISQGQEKIKIAAINTIDDELPLPFKYITKNIYPLSYNIIPPRGCECTNGCTDSARCACAKKNGGEIPFNSDGAIVQAKPLIYECGPSCRCPPSCPNRVSQHGINISLEIFKTENRGWGVRSLSSIPSGSFVCEYIGEMLQDKYAEQTSNDEYLFDIGHNYDDKDLWDGLPSIIPGLLPSSSCETVENEGFTIDAAKFGNIGRFINHCCSPNLYAQNVLYDHDDARMPHIMFFAAENIPPLQELTYHYNYALDQVRDSEGNIKKKFCYCGAADCSGRLY